MKKGQEIEVRVEKLAYGGQGVARFENQVMFIEGGIPGDLARVRVQKIKRNYLQARLVKVIEASPLRQAALCRHFGFCGGCKWQNLEYQQQIKFKQEQVVESLHHIAGIQPEVVHPTIPSPLVFGYRNKMEFSFTDNRWLTSDELSDPTCRKGYALGLHVPGAFDRIMHIEKCWLQDDTMNAILQFTQQYFQENPLPVFNLKAHTGLLRFLVIRKSFHYQNYMVNIVTFTPAAHQLKAYIQSLTFKFPAVISIVNTVNRRYAQIAFSEEEYLLHGDQTISEKLDQFEFAISANSFFQTNPLQAKNLYHTVAEFVGKVDGTVWDLYSGTGTIAMFVSSRASSVLGFELLEVAVNDAYRNCQRNNLGNCQFISGDIRQNIRQQRELPEVIICDPPRSGMHPDIVATLGVLRPAKIVYVSCNPATMARDIKPLTDFYRVTEVQPVDMFPHTFHIESVVKMERK